MGSAPKVMSGARCKIGFQTSSPSGTPEFAWCGIYNNFHYGVVLDLAPAYVLGRFSAASLDYTAMEPVQCSANAYRVINFGPHVGKAGTGGGGHVPRLINLLSFQNLAIAVYDRVSSPVSNKPIALIREVKPAGYNTALSARQLEEMSMTYTGLLVDDESDTNSEPADSLDLPE